MVKNKETKIEWILIAIITLTTGYKLGEGGAKVEIKEQGEYCIQQQLGVDECYEVRKKEKKD